MAQPFAAQPFAGKVPILTTPLEPGDLAFFERVQSVVWTVHERFRKGFHADSPEPLPF